MRIVVFCLLFFCGGQCFSGPALNRFDFSNHAHRDWIPFAENKRTILFFHSPSCGFSAHLIKLLEETELQEYLANKFILRKVDFETEKNIVTEFSISGVPALLFFRSDGTEYFRRFGMRGDENTENFMMELDQIYSADSDLRSEDINSLLQGNTENIRVFAILDTMRQRGLFEPLFRVLKENNLCERDYLYMRAEAYFKLQKFNRASLFFFLAFLDEIEMKSPSGWHRRL